MTVSELKTWPSLSPEMAIPKQPIATPRDERLRQAGPPAALVGDARNEHDRDDGEADPGEDDGRRESLEDDPADDRDDRREDAGDRRDDAHPPDRETAIQRGDADAAEDTRHEAEQQVGPGRHRLTARTIAMAIAISHPDELRQEHDAVDGRAPAGQPTTEVGGTPRRGGGEPERDRRGSRRERVDQPVTPMGAGSSGASDGSSTPSSTAVGPGSSTTASAALSYRSEVVR